MDYLNARRYWIEVAERAAPYCLNEAEFRALIDQVRKELIWMIFGP